MVRVYTYNDIRHFNQRQHKVNSNLCTWYYSDRKKFCGNYSSRKNNRFNKRCWRHVRTGTPSAMLPPVILLMISASERTYNRELWIEFLRRCQEQCIPIELVIYHEDMLNCTVRSPHNLVSRFRPFPDMFGSVLPLRNQHGSINFTQIYLRMLEYGCKVPHATRCIVLTERTIPIRSPVKIYRKALASKCHIDISYNVGYGPVPRGLLQGARNKPFQGVNNLCQGLYTTEFLKLALKAVPRHCERFGIAFNKGVYTIANIEQFEQWRTFTGANPSEFWLLNSYLLDLTDARPMQRLKQYMETCSDNDRYTIAEVPQWRDGWKRTYIFKDRVKRELIPRFDSITDRYYKGLDLKKGVSLLEIIRYLRRNKQRALFFRQVELP